MWTTYPVLSKKLHVSFVCLLILNFSGKNGKSLCSSCNFFEYSTSTSSIYLFSEESSSYFFINF